MINFRKTIVLITICWIQFGFSQKQVSKNCKSQILAYLETMEKVITPASSAVYHMNYTTETVFFDAYNIPVTSTKTDMLMSNKKIAMDDENMKVYGDEKNVFVVLPKVKKIYWNNSDPKLFTENNSYKNFLDIERSLLESAEQISCSSLNNTLDRIVIIPSTAFVKATGLMKQVLEYDKIQKRVVRVENQFNNKSKVKKQIVKYEILDYESNKKIKEPLAYIFSGSNLKPSYKNFEIIDNRKK